ncbi:PREDICTED: ribonuclease P protein subunit p40-like [Vollenhovia emeryi]|uniref:ribonuclease P protein subunit p40-like n=1 Tax=Vollenhovia emeryi TaxID=411798 RepID=UPI0005F4AF5E|nr:PREDICTED: ribonuclease P protein subunit p40-like [Vollenhovia emeryi]
MLSPEAWNFHTPSPYTSLGTVDYRKDVPAVVKTHYYNHSVSVVLPDSATVPQRLRDCLSEDTSYYRINQLRASDLVNAEFIEAFVKKGEINLMAIETKIDLQNSICLTPTGCLILSLLADDYNALGLDGTPSVFGRKPHTRYIVRIDLKDENFIPGKKKYESVRTALEERLKQTFDVIVSWDSPGVSVCPSSVAAWFHERKYVVRVCCQKLFHRTKYSVEVPTYKDKGNECDKNFFEWLGVFSIEGDISEGDEDYANTYQCSLPSVHIGQVQYLQWTGFFSRKKIQEVYNVLKKYVLSRKSLLWVSLDVQGFADSPISFDLKEHTFYTDGDNSYTIVFRNNGEAVVRGNLSSNKR